MIPVFTQKRKRTALFGLGGSGLATARALKAGGADLVVFDDNPQKVEQAQAEGFAAADFRLAGLFGYDMLVLSPGVPLTHPKPHWAAALAHEAGVQVVGDVELFARERRASGVDCPFVAITGTNGKSTTTALTAHVLREAGLDVQMGGNIGVPVLSLKPFAPGRAYVVECSSYQIDLAPTLDPTVGVLLNLTPDHLDRHGTMEHYASVKERLVARSANAVIGCDDDWCRAIADRLEKTVAVFGISAERPLPERTHSFFADGTVLKFATGDVATSIVGDMGGIGSLRGAHNVQNALAALAAATIAAPDLPWERHIEAMRSFPGLAHRMEQVARIGRVLFVNDSKATNADAAEKALSSYPRIYWIAGGLAKEGGIAPLAPYFPRIARAYLIGEAAPQFAATIGAAAPFVISQTIGAAVAQAAADAATDPADEPVVLLSPACASFDQFQNFEKRGDAFRAAVLALPGAEPMNR